MFQHRWFFYVLFITLLLSSCASRTSHEATDLRPISCHREFGVGMLFITIENYANDAAPSTMIVTFRTNLPKVQDVELAVKTPEIPSQAARTLAVDLPNVPSTSSFMLPVGRVTIIADATKVLLETNRAHTILRSACTD